MGLKKSLVTMCLHLTPQQWIKVTDALGIISKSGRYEGTYAHTDIAF